MARCLLIFKWSQAGSSVTSFISVGLCGLPRPGYYNGLSMCCVGLKRTVSELPEVPQHLTGVPLLVIPSSSSVSSHRSQQEGDAGSALGLFIFSIVPIKITDFQSWWNLINKVLNLWFVLCALKKSLSIPRSQIMYLCFLLKVFVLRFTYDVYGYVSFQLLS